MRPEYHEMDGCDKGKVVDSYLTGDDECDAYTYRYQCGGVYHNNEMDIVGCRDHMCWWDCSQCKRKKNKEVQNGKDA